MAGLIKHNNPQVKSALLTIFGPEYNQRDLPEPSLLKQAYRKRAMLIHPDRSKLTGMNEIRLEEEFKKLSLAYKLLHSLIAIKTNQGFTAKTGKMHMAKARHAHHAPMYARKNNLPTFKMRLAFFLYRKGIIDWDTIIDALIWQTKNRPRVGEIGIKCRYLRSEQIYNVLKNRTPGQRFLETARQGGLLDRFQINVILYLQGSYNLPIGRYFIEKNILKPQELDKLVEELKEYNLSLAKNRA